MLKFWDWAEPSLVLLNLLMNWTVFCKTTYFVQDQDQDLSWFGNSVKTNTWSWQAKSWILRPRPRVLLISLVQRDHWFSSRPRPRLVLIWKFCQDRDQYLVLTGQVLNFETKTKSLAEHWFFESIIPSMRTSKIQNGCQGAPKWPTGSGKGSNPRLLAILSNFRKISFLIRALRI